MDQSGQIAVPGVLYVRGGVVESVHTVHVAVVDADGRLVARAGDPRLVAFYRSAAKPLQALPLVEDGVVERFGLTGEQLALCCASHNAEPGHLATARTILEAIGLAEDDLECGPHLPLREEEAHRLLAEGGRPGRLHDNCSGKHAGMLALALHHGWETEGYIRPEHPVQRRMLDEVSRWTGLEPDGIATGTDGCGVVSFAVPLERMALSFARFAAAARDRASGPGRIVEAMTTHPWHVAGTGRLCTALMERAGAGATADPGGSDPPAGRARAAGEGGPRAGAGDAGEGLFVKTGAEGVYCAGLSGRGLGVALKVEDGAKRAADPALVRILESLDALPPDPDGTLEPFRRPPIRNTRDEEVGELVASFELEEAS